MAVAPLWLVYTLSGIFLAGATYYTLRLFSPGMIRRAYGWYDPENEGVHLLCLFIMGLALAPAEFEPSARTLVHITLVGAFWYLLRSMFWGRKVKYAAEWWWDWAHFGMLLCMAPMFSSANLGALHYVVLAFWIWFTGYYVYSVVHDLRQPKLSFLSLASDFFHLTMGLVMLVMEISPMTLMPPGPSMPGMCGTF